MGSKGQIFIYNIIFDQKSHHFPNESFLHDQICSKMSAFFDGERSIVSARYENFFIFGVER